MDILMRAWSYFATNILQQPAWMIGLIVLIGYILLKKPWYDVLGGTLKAVIGYMILAVGSSGLVNNFRPVLVGLGERFNLDAMVIDPYFGQNAVTAGVEEVFGKPFSQVMILLLLAPAVFGAAVPGSLPHYFAALAVYIAVSLGIGCVLGLTVKSQSKLTMAAQLIFLPSIMLSGILFPADLLPDFLKTAGKLFPAPWGYACMLNDGLRPENLWYMLLLLCLAAFLCAILLKKQSAA